MKRFFLKIGVLWVGLGLALSNVAWAQEAADPDLKISIRPETNPATNDIEEVQYNPNQTLPLSFEKSIQIGLRNNLQTRIAREQTHQARGQLHQARAGIMPQLDGRVYQVRRTTNLVAEGFDPNFFPFLRNTVIGPYNNFDARVQILQKIFDLNALETFKAGKSQMLLAKLQVILAQENVAQLVGLSYVQVLQTQASVSATQADLRLSKRLLKQTQDQMRAGTATQVDLIRAQTNLSDTETQLLSAQVNEETARLNFKKALLLPLDQPIRLTNPLQPSHPNQTPPSVQQATNTAQSHRPELKIAQEQIQLAHHQQKAALGNQIPSISFGANYGYSGTLPNENDNGTYQFGGQLNIPIFDGGYTLGSMAAAKSQKKQAEIQLNDLKEEVNKEVRIALQTLKLSSQRLVSAQKTLQLAKRELKLARDQFATGVKDNVEVIQAQTTLAQARQTQVNALADYQSARIQLATALGLMEEFQL